MSVGSASPDPSPLCQPVTTLHGVGSERAALLSKLGILTVEDLLLHRPRRYEDRRYFRPIAETQLGEPVLTRGRIVALGVKWFARRARSIFELILDDGTARLHCRWWNMHYLEKQFATGQELMVFGKLLGAKPRTIDHPEVELVQPGEEERIHMSRLTPVYPLTEGMGQRWLRGLIYRCVREMGDHIREPWPLDSLPEGATQVTRSAAIRMLHCPEAEADPGTARERLALDEFVELQRRMQQRRQRFQLKSTGLPCGGNNRLIKPFLAALPFRLTGAQTKVLREIRKDMHGAHPMRRLLQGDVGSGKTVVAACAALMAIESGYCTALMAPTEILAEQHFRNFGSWLSPMNVPVHLRTGSHQTSNGGAEVVQPSMWIGTHALLSEGVELPRLGLVIIDEQHRFGVSQREELVRKGTYPHLLVMTATPIPRTLGLTLYGDLDISLLDEAPEGRGRIQTFVRSAESLGKVWEFVRAQVAAGRQAYVIYPRVEDTGGAQVKAVVQEFEKLQKLLAPYRTGLLHGRLRRDEKESVMAGFRSGAITVLVATSLIEVGVDVANATVMVIESAEQFGLAQLHQMRGRVGRGAADSFCILVSSAKTQEARKRLCVLETSTNGFEIAEADLKLRGPGELLGHEQSGVPAFRFGDLRSDLPLVQLAKRIAARISV